MLATFEQIRGLVFLMSWDHFEDDVLAKLKMANELWSERKNSSDDGAAPLPLVSNADQVAYQVKQMWWVFTKLHPELASMINL